MLFFFFNDTATTEIYTLSLHDALPIFPMLQIGGWYDIFLAGTFENFLGLSKLKTSPQRILVGPWTHHGNERARSEEHTSELQSPCNLVCRLLLEKKKNHLLR